MTELCAHYGFSTAKLAGRCRLVGLSESDHTLAEAFQRRVVEPHADRVVEALFTHLAASNEVMAILQEGYDLGRLKGVLRDYLLSMGRGFDTLEYCEARLRIGLAHARAGVPVGLFVTAHARLRELLMAAMNEKERRELGSFLAKIGAFDAGLAGESYYIRRARQFQTEMALLRRTASRLRRRAETDPLTSLANRESVLEMGRRTLRNLRRDAEPFCAVMVDLDHFKRVNDHHGHPVGDGVLQEVAHRMEAAVRDFDTVGRYGGEEFLVLLRHADLTQGHEITERMRTRVAATPIELDGVRIPMTISAGIAAANGDETLDALIQRADDALYQAKRQGRNRVVIAK